MTDLPMAAISTVPAAAPPTPEQVMAGFTPDMTRAAQIAAMLASVPPNGELALVARMSSGLVMAYSPDLGLGTAAGLLGEALEKAPDGTPLSWPMLAATYGDTSTGSGGTAMVGSGFQTIGFDKVEIDTHNGFDLKTGIYTAQQDGFYFLTSTLRLADGNIAGQSYGLGVDKVEQDSPRFAWAEGTPDRQWASFSADVVPLKKGDQVHAFRFYNGAPTTYIAATLTIRRIG